jgi:hypothetical protein
MLHISYLLFIYLLLLTSLVFAQAPEIEWSNSYQGPGKPFFVMQTSDGGYIMTGGQGALSARKVHANGDPDWQQEVASGSQTIGYHICEAADGNFILAGAVSGDRALAKLRESDGEVMWQKTFSGTGIDAFKSVELTADGGFITTGFVNASEWSVFITDGGQGFLLKTDSLGDLDWEEIIPAPMYQGMRARPINGGYAVAGCSYDENYSDFGLAIADLSGNVIHQYQFGSTGDEHLYDMDLALDGGFILGGHTTPAVGLPAAQGGQ